MIWLAERVAALVVIVIGSQILRGWWQSQAWLRAAVVAVLNGEWHILCVLALFFALLPPI
jgi:hypothetical protein